MADRIWSKIDRVLSNGDFLRFFPTATIKFVANFTSDHCYAVVYFDLQVVCRPKPFKFLNS